MMTPSKLSLRTLHGRLAGLAILAFSLLTGYTVSSMYDERGIANGREQLLEVSKKLALQLSSETLRSQVMGGTLLQGLNLPVLKKAASTGSLTAGELDAVHTELNPTRVLFGAEGVYLIGPDGTILAHETEGKKSIGSNVSFRPYFQRAMDGKPNVYAAVGNTTGERGLYYAAPLHAGNDKNTPVIGVTLVKLPAEPLDTLLGSTENDAVLLSPQGIVFATTKPEWLYSVTPPVSTERLESIRKLKQFGKQFESGKLPKTLPFSPEDSEISIADQRYGIAYQTIDWADPAGLWTVVLIKETSAWVNAAEHRWFFAGSSALTLLFFLLLVQVWRSHVAKQAYVTQLKAHAVEQEASARYKSELASAAIRMQQSQSIEDLGQFFLSEAHRLLGALQGTVYAAMSDEQSPMQRIASYACFQPPPESLRPGEGLLGQCVLERRTLIISSPPEGFWQIRSGLGEARPGMLAIMPVQLNEALLGVVEIALPAGSDTQITRLEEMLTLLALNLTIQRRTQVAHSR